MRLFRRGRKNNKGFSLVEVVCAIAILGLTSTAIGSAMVISTRSYQRGSAEVDVQKEAQTTTNLIGNLLVDAVAVDYQEVAGTSKTLKIDGEGVTYTLVYDENTDEISYTEQVTGGTPVNGTLAENVTSFDVDVTKFASDKNATVELAIEKNGKNYEATYSTTARNGASVSTGASEVAMIICENEVTLEPGHSYTLPIVVYGLPAGEAGISYSSISGVGSSAVGTTYLSGESAAGVTINLGNDATGTLAFSISTKNDAEGNPLDTKTVTVNVRRVTAVNCTRSLESGESQKAGAVYRIYAQAAGTNLDKKIGRAYDDNYKNPRYIDFDVTMTGGVVDNYVEILETVEDVDMPYIRFKLKADMPYGSKITTTATSKHSLGTIGGVQYTKQGYAYNEPVRGTDVLDSINVISSSNGLKRGNDCLDFTTVLDLETLKSTYGGEITWLFRYKPEGGNWTQYYKTKEEGSEQKVNALETYLFDIDKSYEYELMFALIDWSNKTLEWPHDPSLLAAGKGFAEYGITQGWTDDEVGVGLSATSPEQYSEVFPLGRTEINYTGVDSYASDGIVLNLPTGYDAEGKPECVLCAPSSGDPYQVSKSANQGFGISFATVNLDKGQYSYTYNLQKSTTSGGVTTWTDINKSDYGLNISVGGGASSSVKVENTSGATVGHYRIGIMVVNNKYGTINAASNISNLIIDVDSTTGGNWAAHGTKVVEEGGVNKSVEYGYVYFDIVN